MEKFFEELFKAENLRTMVLLVGIICAALWQKFQIRKQLDNLETKIDAKLEPRFEKIDARFEKIDARFEKIDARFEEIDDRFKEIDDHFKKIDDRFKEIEARIDKLDNSIDGRVEAIVVKHQDIFYKKLKENDFRHLTDALRSLAFVLNKNNLIEDKDMNFLEKIMSEVPQVSL